MQGQRHPKWHGTPEQFAARDALVLKFKALVWKIAIAYFKARHGQGKRLGTLEDCVQQGMIGLILAAERYRPESNVKFITYAHKCIWGQISGEARRFRKHWFALQESAIRGPWRPDVSVSYFEVLATEQRKVPEEKDHLDDQNRVKKYMTCLNEREEKVLRDHSMGYTFQEIGAAMGITRARAQQLNVAAIKKIRKVFGEAV